MKKVISISIVILSLISNDRLYSQMQSHVTSAADDEFAHAYDFQVTPNIDESSDGICEDSMHRCTLRAALEEADILGQWADVLVEVNDIIKLTEGGFSPPDHSIISATGYFPVIDGNGLPAIFAIENQVTIYGLTLKNAGYGIIIGGNENLIGTVTSDKNRITNMSEAGILIAGDQNRIVGNWIGLYLGGAASGSKYGIFITGKENVIGGNGPDQGNVISGNDIGIGVYIVDSLGNDRNYIKGNFIGTDASGTQAIPNRVGIDNIGPNLSIGGLTIQDANVISGNSESGILLGLDADDILIGGNRIGVDINGTLPIPNRDGITLGPGTLNTIVEQNFIARNTQNGILISGITAPMLDTKNNIIRGNTIFSNGNAGIAITGTAEDNIIGSSLSQNYSPNEIESNGASGVLIAPGFANPERNTIRKNSFQDNGFLGIQIAGGQGNIQSPVLASYDDPGQGFATVTGTHPLAGAVIDFYAGDANPLHNYEGVEWLGSGGVNATGHFSVLIPTCFCDTIVATATDMIGNTSEFSEGLAVIITAVADPPSKTSEVMIIPNPFHTETIIHFYLHQAENVRLNVYDMTGKEIKSIVNDHLQEGEYQFSWTPTDQSSGMYYYQFIIGSHPVETGKLIFIND